MPLNFGHSWSPDIQTRAIEPGRTAAAVPERSAP